MNRGAISAFCFLLSYVLNASESNEYVLTKADKDNFGEHVIPVQSDPTFEGRPLSVGCNLNRCNKNEAKGSFGIDCFSFNPHYSTNACEHHSHSK